MRIYGTEISIRVHSTPQQYYWYYSYSTNSSKKDQYHKDHKSSIIYTVLVRVSAASGLSEPSVVNKTNAILGIAW